MGNLVISRRAQQTFTLKFRDAEDTLATVTVVEISPSGVRIAITAPPEIEIYRDDCRKLQRKEQNHESR